MNYCYKLNKMTNLIILRKFYNNWYMKINSKNHLIKIKIRINNILQWLMNQNNNQRKKVINIYIYKLKFYEYYNWIKLFLLIKISILNN